MTTMSIEATLAKLAAEVPAEVWARAEFAGGIDAVIAEVRRLRGTLEAIADRWESTDMGGLAEARPGIAWAMASDARNTLKGRP